jgi:hypothetical protein
VEATTPSRAATRLDRLATTWCQTDLSKSVEVPFTPINSPLTVKVDKNLHVSMPAKARTHFCGVLPGDHYMHLPRIP